MRLPPILLSLTVLACAGLAACSRTPTAHDREQADALDADAEMAMTLRQWSRAEGLLVQAAALCPDAGGYWMALGESRANLGEKDAARAAYKSALSAYRAEYKRSPADGRAAAQQVTLLSLLGRADEAREFLVSERRLHPDDPSLRRLDEDGGVDRIVADPRYAKLAI